MKRIIPCLIFCFPLMIHYALAQNQGKVIEQLSIKSAILKRDVHYTVYLPADYETSQRNYPVVYLLHGYTDDNKAWLQAGEINRYADKAIEDGAIPPMIIIMPNGDSSWYINSYDGKEKYEDFFTKEFIPGIDRAYHTKASKNFRGVAGLSMGGFGAMIYAIKYPEIFAAAAALSAGIFPDDQLTGMPNETYESIFGQLYGRGLKGDDRLNAAWKSNSVLSLVSLKKGEDLNKVRYWIDCGDDDFLTKGNCLLHIALTEKKVPHEFRVRDGAHTWKYWRTGIIDALAFIGDSFRDN